MIDQTKKRRAIGEKVSLKIREYFTTSASLRSSLNLFKMLLINGVIFFLILSGLLVNRDLKQINDEAKTVVALIELTGNANDEQIKDNIFYEILKLTDEYNKYEENQKIEKIENIGKIEKTEEISPEEVVYSFVPKEIKEKKYNSLGFYFKIRSGNVICYRQRDFSVEVGDTEYVARFYFDISETVDRSIYIIKWMFVVYIIFETVLLVENYINSKRMFIPVREMTSLAKNYSVSEGERKRLNVAGPQDELRELAEVLNEMLDRLEKSYETQKQFVSNASHELRTPIAVIRGYSDMLSRWGMSDEAVLKESIEAISQESKAMKELVEKLLFISRHDRNTLKPNMSDFYINEIMEEIIRETRMTVTEREIITEKVDCESIYADSQLIKQAIRILVDNAVKYTEPGGKITLSCEVNENYLIIKVEDNGMGIKPGEISKVYDRFYRSDDVRNKNIEGHGLGLSIARLIVSVHSGRIDIRSKYGEGSTFRIILPIKQKQTKEENAKIL